MALERLVGGCGGVGGGAVPLLTAVFWSEQWREQCCCDWHCIPSHSATPNASLSCCWLRAQGGGGDVMFTAAAGSPAHGWQNTPMSLPCALPLAAAAAAAVAAAAAACADPVRAC
jgi:hypothetical protein